MRIIISSIFLILSIACTAQRVSFEDPDLGFSFKKPKNWQVFDDGYVVKVSPSIQDTSRLYLTVTYFESPAPFGFNPESDLPHVIPFETSEPSSESIESQGTIRIAKVEATYRTSSTQMDGIKMNIRHIHFSKFGQSWELVTSSPYSERKSSEKDFRRILKSLRITRK